MSDSIKTASRILPALIAAAGIASCGIQAKRDAGLVPAPVAASAPSTPIAPSPSAPTPAVSPTPAATPASMADPQARPIATVNGEPITLKEFAVGFPAYRKGLDFPPDTAQLRSQYLEQLIGEKLLEQEIRRRGLDNDPEFVSRLSAARRKAIEEALAQDGATHAPEAGEAEALAYYQQQLSKFAQPEAIQVRNITTDTREAAIAARNRILRGEPFAKVASSASIHSSRVNGGTLPPLSRGTYNKAFEDRAFSLRLGELSDVFQTELGWHIVEKTGETPAQTAPFEAVKDKIMASLARKNGEGSLDKLEKSLRASADVRLLTTP